MQHANLGQMNQRSPDSVEVRPASRIDGDIVMPGDKSISHRFAMIGSLATGETTIRNFASSGDSHSTLDCLSKLGVRFREVGSNISIEGQGVEGFICPTLSLNAGNSGTTVRILSGILAACPWQATFIGDESLSRRPMKRVIEPLRAFGAKVAARDDNFLPLTVRGGPLQAIEYRLPVPSAQVKSAVLLAGLHARGKTRVIEPIPSRNHTEIALRRFGAKVETDGETIEIEGGQLIRAQTLTVPGDVSSAAFLVAASLGVLRSSLRVRDVGLNPTRTGFLALLQDCGAKISVEAQRMDGEEPVGDLIVQNSDLSAMEVNGRWVGNVIDEIPILAVLGTRMTGGIRIRDAAELRAKESDRIRSIVDNLRALAVEVEEFEDGLFVPGVQRIRGGRVDSFKDHRIAMAFAVAGLFAEEPVTIENTSCVNISFPGFFDLLRTVVL